MKTQALPVKGADRHLLQSTQVHREATLFGVPDHPTLSPDPFDLLISNVVALRAEGRWSTRALAGQAHVSRSSVVELEKGHVHLSLHILDKIARALVVKTGPLLGKRPVARDEADGLTQAVLALNLATTRKRLKLSQDQLSQRSGINRVVIAEIETQARNPSLQTLAKLAVALDQSIEALLTSWFCGLETAVSDPQRASDLQRVLRSSSSTGRRLPYGAIPTAKHRPIGGIVTIQLLGVSADPGRSMPALNRSRSARETSLEPLARCDSSLR